MQPSPAHRDRHSRDESAASFIQAIRLNKHAEALEMLELNKVDDVDIHHPVLLAAQRGWGDVIVLLVEKGADLNVASEMGETPLMRAIKAGEKIDASVIRRMIKHGAVQTINSRTTTKHFFPEWSALHFACDPSLNKDPYIVASLVLAGADPNLKNTDGATPMDLAKSYPVHLNAIKDPSSVNKSLRRSNSAPHLSPAAQGRRPLLPPTDTFDLDDGRQPDDGERKLSILEFATSLLVSHKPKEPKDSAAGKKKSDASG